MAFSDNSSSGQSENENNLKVGDAAEFRGMGFPNMNYLDPDANGPPLQLQTYYRNFGDVQDNDIKNKREEVSNAQ